MHSTRPNRRSAWSLALAGVSLAAGLATAPAQAQTTPFYGGLNLSVPRWDDAVNGLSGKDSGTGIKAYGGWQINPQFALEAGLVGLGRMNTSAGSVRSRGLFVDAVGTLPIAQQWNLLGRVGLVNAKTSVPGDSDRGTGIKFGAGAEYQLSKTLAVRGEWERYRLSAFGSHPNTDQFSLGVKMGF